MSMRTLDPCDLAVATRTIHGLSADAGRSSSDGELERDLRILNQSSSILRLLGVTFCLRTHSLAFEHPVENNFILGRTKNNFTPIIAYCTCTWKSILTAMPKRSLVKSKWINSSRENNLACAFPMIMRRRISSEILNQCGKLHDLFKKHNRCMQC